ncbi:MAG TPA: DsbA family protein [Candidatus Nanoarchaeia archaeon]|nr:DsbA family protein [Candidatus Nanoarchaeia archaeon]
MTHFEKEEFERKERAEHHPENQVGHHPTEKNTICSSRPEKDSQKLNPFQKFLAVAMILQLLLLVFIAVKISDLSAPTGIADDNGNVPDDILPTKETDSTALIDDDAIKGDKNAPVTIVEFSDYECPFCVKFYSETYSQIEKNYIKTGKVKFIYRDFPLGFHQNAQKAAEAAECAGEQWKYYEMHNKLFEKGVGGGAAGFKQYAKDLGLDQNKFNQCLDSGAMAQEVKKDLADGSKLGVSGTPAFFINGQEIVGAQPYAVFEQIIEQKLKSKN